MKKSIILFFVISVFPLLFQAQNAKIDSLKKQLSIHKQKDTIRVKKLNNLAFLYYRIDANKTITYIEEAEKISDSIGFKKGKGKALFIRGVIQMTLSNFDKAIKYYDQSERLYAEADFKIGVSNCYSGKGNIYSYQGDYEKALVYYNKALQIEEKIGVTKNIPHHMYNIGLVYYYKGMYKEALIHFNKVHEIYYEKGDEFRVRKTLNVIALVYQAQSNYPYALKQHYKSLEIAEKLKDSINISNSLNNIGTIYEAQENYDKALELLKKALIIKQNLKEKIGIAATKNNIASIYIKKGEYLKAIKKLKEALALNRKMSAKKQITISLNKLGSVHVLLKKFIDANKFYEEAKKINIQIGNQNGLSSSYLGIADSFMEKKKYNKALINVLKSLEVSEKLNLLENQRDAHEIFAKIYEIKGEYKKAFESHQQFKTLNDSLFNKENIKKITQLEYEYKYKQELELAGLRELKLTKTVNTVNKNLEKSQRNLLLGVIGFLITALILGTIIFFLKLRNEKAKTQNITIEQKLLRSQMTPHFIFNSLSVLQGMILNKEEKTSVSYLSKFSKLLRITLENSREKTVLLSQELIAIENYLALQNLENQLYQYTVLVADTIDVLLFKVPPMLIQPFVENAIEHGFQNQQENRKIDVYVSFLNKKLICTITDNGVGIDSKEANKKQYKKSLSTTITSERLKILSKDFKMKGAVSIEDRKKYNEQGTLVTLVIPYKLKVCKK